MTNFYRVLLLVFYILILDNTTCTANPFAMSDTTTLEAYLKANKIEAQKSPEGVYYQIQKNTKGKLPKDADYVQILYVGKLLDGTVFDSTDANDPFIFQVGNKQVIQGLDAGIRQLALGNKGTLYIPANMAYGSRGSGKAIPPNAPLIFEIQVLAIMSFQEYDSYMDKLDKQEQASFEAQQKEQFLMDKKLIQEYALAQQLHTKRSGSGLSYIITKSGKGKSARKGDAVSVFYEGKLVNQKIFDSNLNKQPLEVTLGEGKLIEGLEEGLQHFNEGAEGWLFVPSKWATAQHRLKAKTAKIKYHPIRF